MNQPLIITPKTKILQFLEAYPELEDELIGFVPAFSKLKNPVLRRTVGKVATLQQAAAIGNLKVEELINWLRKKAGQDLISGESGNLYNMDRPVWYSEEKVKIFFDAGEMLSRGEHPVAQVMEDLKKLETGDIYCLSAPFLPAPLIDKATSMGALHWAVKIREDAYQVYFLKQ